MQNFQGLIKKKVESPGVIKKISCGICKRDLTQFCGFSRGQALFCLEVPRLKKQTQKLQGFFQKSLSYLTCCFLEYANQSITLRRIKFKSFVIWSYIQNLIGYLLHYSRKKNKQVREQSTQVPHLMRFWMCDKMTKIP